MTNITNAENAVNEAQTLLDEAKRCLQKAKEEPIGELGEIKHLLQRFAWYKPSAIRYGYYDKSNEYITVEFEENQGSTINWNGVSDTIFKAGFHLHSVSFEHGDRFSWIVLKRN